MPTVVDAVAAFNLAVLLGPSRLDVPATVSFSLTGSADLDSSQPALCASYSIGSHSLSYRVRS